MNDSRILIAGIGNIFLGDDAFGVEVVQRLSQRLLPANVRVADFGIRGLDLAYAMLYGEHQVTILVDAAARGGTPGTVYLIEPEQDSPADDCDQQEVVNAHGMNPMAVLRVVKSMGGSNKRTFVVGCEPMTFGPEEGAMGLSEPVAAGVGEAVYLIESVIDKILSGEPQLVLLPDIIQGGERHGTA